MDEYSFIKKHGRNLNIESLPEKDIKLGKKFLEERNFISLKELVDSAIIRINKNLKTSKPREEYLKVNMDNLLELQSDVNIYLMESDPDFDLNGYDEEDEFDRDLGMDDDF